MNKVAVMSILTLLVSGYASTSSVPASKFDLSHWKITIPLDHDNNGKADDIDTKAF